MVSWCIIFALIWLMASTWLWNVATDTVGSLAT